MNNLTAIIISFLRPGYTKACIKSLKETYPDIQFMVAENGEYDRDMEQFVKDHGGQYFDLPFDSGVCIARNFLVRQVKTDFILIGDDDFLYGSEAKVDQMLDFIENNDQFDLIGGRIFEGHKIRNYQGNFEINEDHIKYNALDINKRMQRDKSGLQFKECDITFNFFVARTKLLKEILWDENIKVRYEHSDWFLAVKKANRKVVFSPDPIVIHKAPGVNPGIGINVDYKYYRSRASDKEYFFEKHNIAYIQGFNGVIDKCPIMSGIENTDFLITTFERPEALEKLLISIIKYYPDANIIIGDQSKKFKVKKYQELWKKLFDAGLQNKPTAHNLPYDCGLSFARNFLIEHSEAKYKLILEDDFEFTEDTKIETMVKLLKNRPKTGIVGGEVIKDGIVTPFEFKFAKKGDLMQQESDGDNWENIDNVKVKPTGSVMNFMMVRREVFLDVKWDPAIKIHGEHTDFFWRLSETDWEILFTPEVKINHIHNSNDNYKPFRKRREFYKKVFRKHNITKFKYLNGQVYELIGDDFKHYREN